MNAKLMRGCACAFAAVVFASHGWAQPAEPPGKFYKLTFVVKEVEFDRTVNSRTYQTMVSTDRTNNPGCSIRAGSKLSIPSSPSSTSTTFVDIGVNIDCSFVRDLDDELSLRVSAEISSIPEDSATKGYHLIRQNRWNSFVVVPLSKPTLIFLSDDVTSNKRQLQVELTASPIRAGTPIR